MVLKMGKDLRCVEGSVAISLLLATLLFTVFTKPSLADTLTLRLPPPPSPNHVWIGTKYFGEVHAAVTVDGGLPYHANLSYRDYFLDMMVGAYFPNITGEGTYTFYGCVTRNSNRSYPLDSHLEIQLHHMPFPIPERDERRYNPESETLYLIVNFWEVFYLLPPLYREISFQSLITKVYENITDIPIGIWDIWMKNVTVSRDESGSLVATEKPEGFNFGSYAPFITIAVLLSIMAVDLYFTLRKRFIRKAETQNQPE